MVIQSPLLAFCVQELNLDHSGCPHVRNFWGMGHLLDKLFSICRTFQFLLDAGRLRTRIAAIKKECEAKKRMGSDTRQHASVGLLARTV